jgi:hypothetical protein
VKVAGLKGTIEFMPNQNCPKCKQIKLIQTIRIRPDWSDIWATDSLTGTQGAFQINPQQPWPLSQCVEPAWFIDVNKQNIQILGEKPTLFYQDNNPVIENKVGSNIEGKPPVTSIIGDDPHTSIAGQRFEFETAAFCVDTKQFLGSVRWGFITKHSDANDVLSLASEALPTSVSATPSLSLLIASGLFTSYYAGQ